MMRTPNADGVAAIEKIFPGIDLDALSPESFVYGCGQKGPKTVKLCGIAEILPSKAVPENGGYHKPEFTPDQSVELYRQLIEQEKGEPAYLRFRGLPYRGTNTVPRILNPYVHGRNGVIGDVHIPRAYVGALYCAAGGLLSLHTKYPHFSDKEMGIIKEVSPILFEQTVYYRYQNQENVERLEIFKDRIQQALMGLLYNQQQAKPPIYLCYDYRDDRSRSPENHIIQPIDDEDYRWILVQPKCPEGHIPWWQVQELVSKAFIEAMMLPDSRSNVGREVPVVDLDAFFGMLLARALDLKDIARHTRTIHEELQNTLPEKKRTQRDYPAVHMGFGYYPGQNIQAVPFYLAEDGNIIIPGVEKKFTLEDLHRIFKNAYDKADKKRLGPPIIGHPPYEGAEYLGLAILSLTKNMKVVDDGVSTPVTIAVENILEEHGYGGEFLSNPFPTKTYHEKYPQKR